MVFVYARCFLRWPSHQKTHVDLSGPWKACGGLGICWGAYDTIEQIGRRVQQNWHDWWWLMLMDDDWFWLIIDDDDDLLWLDEDDF